MRIVQMRLFLIILIFSAISSLLMKGQGAVRSETGIGILKEGPYKALAGNTIEYRITVYNLGDYWIRNITVKDEFPNGTSSLWDIPDLSPSGQLEDSYTILGIFYTIEAEDVVSGPPSHIVNHAEVIGYSDVDGLYELVHAKTDYPTRVYFAPVGGYSVSIKTEEASITYTMHIILLFLISAAFIIFRCKTNEKNKK